MLRVVSLRKSYPAGRRLWGVPARTLVLDGVEFEAAPGEIVGLLGANGAGKTTALHCIAGLMPPDSGLVEFDGAILDERRARTSVGLSSSADRSFYYRLTMRENLVFFGRLHGLHGSELQHRVEATLASVALHDLAERRYEQCSTGMRQRLSLARALLHDPPVLLLDEPTRAVDAMHASRFRAFWRDELATRARKTIVLATNLLEEAWSVCDRVVFLSEGRGRAIPTPASFGAMRSLLHEVAR